MFSRLFSRFSFREWIVLIVFAIVAAVVGPRTMAAVNAGELTPAEQELQLGWAFVTSFFEGEEVAAVPANEEVPAPNALADEAGEQTEADRLVDQSEGFVEAADDAALIHEQAVGAQENSREIQSRAQEMGEWALQELQLVHQRLQNLGATDQQLQQVEENIRIVRDLLNGMGNH